MSEKTLADFPSDPPVVMLAGDWHGNSTRAVVVLNAAADEEIGVVVHLGDFGFWTPGHASDSYLNAVEQRCAALGVTLLWVDGNHEDHTSLNAIPLADNGTRYIRPHIIHLPRGFRWTWAGKIWMALGGAHSVDSHVRKLGVSVWDEEHLSEGDVSRAIAGGPVDIIVAHDCPDNVHIPNLPSHLFPVTQIAIAEQHRGLVGKVVDAVRPSILIHGHYHTRYTSQRPLPDGGVTKIVGLSDDRSPLHDNVAVFRVLSAD